MDAPRQSSTSARIKELSDKIASNCTAIDAIAEHNTQIVANQEVTLQSWLATNVDTVEQQNKLFNEYLHKLIGTSGSLSNSMSRRSPNRAPSSLRQTPCQKHICKN